MAGLQPKLHLNDFFDMIDKIWKKLRNIERNLPDEQSDTVTVNGVAATVVTLAVVFDRPFDATPDIFLTCFTSGPNQVWASYTAPSSTGFTLNYYRPTTGPSQVSWLARLV